MHTEITLEAPDIDDNKLKFDSSDIQKILDYNNKLLNMIKEDMRSMHVNLGNGLQNVSSIRNNKDYSYSNNNLLDSSDYRQRGTNTVNYTRNYQESNMFTNTNHQQINEQTFTHNQTNKSPAKSSVYNVHNLSHKETNYSRNISKFNSIDNS